MSEPTYLGPWMKFSRARDRHGFPIISVTRDGKSWKHLKPVESWDIIVMLRGPDGTHLSSEIKKRTTSPIRGLFIAWKLHEVANTWSRSKPVGRGAVARPPMTIKWDLPKPLMEELANSSWHFRAHWRGAWEVIEKYLGGWPLDVKEDDETSKQ